MNFAVDCYFSIGQAHLNGGKPCQDYAFSDVNDGAALCIVSDGCSSGGHTDVGARILALSTANAIREHWVVYRSVLSDTVLQELGIRQRIAIIGFRETLGLAHKDMLATCLYQYITISGGFIHVRGDGILALKKRSGRITMYRYEWIPDKEGYVKPFYPAYAEDNYRTFIQSHGGDVNSKRMTEECWEYDTCGVFHKVSVQTLTLGEGIRGITTMISSQELETLDCIAIFSDGLTQVDGIDWKDAVVQLMAFKTTAGEFAKRRMMRFIRDTKIYGRGPIDDISYGVVRIVLPEGGDTA